MTFLGSTIPHENLFLSLELPKVFCGLLTQAFGIRMETPKRFFSNSKFQCNFCTNFCFGHIIFKQHKDIQKAIKLLGSMHFFRRTTILALLIKLRHSIQSKFWELLLHRKVLKLLKQKWEIFICAFFIYFLKAWIIPPITVAYNS